MKLNGWHRLWVLLSAIYFILVTAYVILEFPKTENIAHQPEFYKKLSKKSAEMVISEHGPWEEALEEYQKMESKKSDKTNPIDFHPIVEMPNKHTIEFKGSFTKEEMEVVSREYWRIIEQKAMEQRLALVFYAFLFWLIPCLALYAFGWSINWVYKGFKQKKDGNK